VPDYFALVDEPRRPWLEPEELKQKFLALSATVHPDRVHNLPAPAREKAQGHYTELNAAYNCLREDRDRLRHLLELERGSTPTEIQQIPQDLMNVFMEVSQVCRQADAFLSEKSKISSPLLKVQFFERGHEWTEELRHLQNSVRARRESLVDELKTIDAAWIASARSNVSQHAGLLARLEELYRLFSYFDRWLGQIQERITQIML